MAIYDYLPKFHVVEPNNLKGLQPGFVVAQLPVKESSALFNETYPTIVENGQLAKIDVTTNEATMDAWTALEGQNPTMYLVFSEPLNTVFNKDAFYATDTTEELPRFVQLIPGDEWTTDIAYELSGELAKHVAEIKKGNDWFTNQTLADGTEAHHYIYLG